MHHNGCGVAGGKDPPTRKRRKGGAKSCPQAHLPLGHQVAEIQLVQLESQDEVVLRQTTRCMGVELHPYLVVIRQMKVGMVTFRISHLANALETSQGTGKVFHLPFLEQRKLAFGGLSQTPSRHLVPQTFDVLLAQYRGACIARNALLGPQSNQICDGVWCTNLMLRVCVAQRLVPEASDQFAFEGVASTDVLHQNVRVERKRQLQGSFSFQVRRYTRSLPATPRTPPIISEPRARTLLDGGLDLTRKELVHVRRDAGKAFWATLVRMRAKQASMASVETVWRSAPPRLRLEVSVSSYPDRTQVRSGFQSGLKGDLFGFKPELEPEGPGEASPPQIQARDEGRFETTAGTSCLQIQPIVES